MAFHRQRGFRTESPLGESEYRKALLRSSRQKVKATILPQPRPQSLRTCVCVNTPRTDFPWNPPGPIRLISALFDARRLLTRANAPPVSLQRRDAPPRIHGLELRLIWLIRLIPVPDSLTVKPNPRDIGQKTDPTHFVEAT